MTKVYDRKLKKVIEIKHCNANLLSVIYKHKILTKIASSRALSKIYGLFDRTRLSRFKINRFINNYDIDMSLYESQKYKNFNEFFIRKLKNIHIDKDGFISPCNSKLLVYKIDKSLTVNVKGIDYKISDLLNEELDYSNGYIFIYRLDVNDYHRFHYIDDGKTIKRVRIKGKFHTVSSSSSAYKIYKENEREYSILDTKHYGKIIYMEVGAMLVGRIINHNLETFKRGEEKGYFLPGGSTVIVIANNIKVDKDILEYSKKNIETIVHVGEKVGE